MHLLTVMPVTTTNRDMGVQQTESGWYAASGDETSSNDGSMHRSEVDYSTLARAEAAAHQQDPTSSQVGGGDAAPGVLQRSRPLPSSSDAGHLALAAEQAGDADVDGSSQGDWSVASTQHDSRGSAFEDIAGNSPPPTMLCLHRMLSTSVLSFL